MKDEFKKLKISLDSANAIANESYQRYMLYRASAIEKATEMAKYEIEFNTYKLLNYKKDMQDYKDKKYEKAKTEYNELIQTATNYYLVYYENWNKQIIAENKYYEYIYEHNIDDENNDEE